jgi:hypothetical protein
VAAAQASAVRTSLTAEEFEALKPVMRFNLLEAQWDYQRTLIGYTCSDPKNLRTLNANHRVPGVTLPRAEFLSRLERDRDRLSKCEQSVFDHVVAADGPAPVADLIDWGVEYHSQHNLAVTLARFFDKAKSMGTAIKDALASLVPDPSSSTASSEGSGDQRSSSGSSSSGSSNRSSNIDVHSEALEQLKGIAASGHW